MLIESNCELEQHCAHPSAELLQQLKENAGRTIAEVCDNLGGRAGVGEVCLADWVICKTKTVQQTLSRVKASDVVAKLKKDKRLGVIRNVSDWRAGTCHLRDPLALIAFDAKDGSNKSAANAWRQEQPTPAAQVSLVDQPAPQLQPLQRPVLAAIALPPAAGRSQQMCACCEKLRTQLQARQAEVDNAKQLLVACERHVAAAASQHNANCSKLQHALSQCNVALEAAAVTIASKQATVLQAQQASSATSAELQRTKAQLSKAEAALCTCRSREQQHAEHVKVIGAQKLELELSKHKLAAELHDAQHTIVDALERAECAGMRTLVCMLAIAAINVGIPA